MRKDGKRKMTMKRVRALLLTATMLTGMLTGCGGKSQESAANEEPQVSAAAALINSYSASSTNYIGNDLGTLIGPVADLPLQGENFTNLPAGVNGMSGMRKPSLTVQILFPE